MSEHLDEYAVRTQKVEQLKQANIPPYANQFKKTESIEDLYKRKEETNLPPADLLLSEGSENTYSTAGRLMTYRSHGKLSFGTIRDNTGDIQIAFVRDLCKIDTGSQIVSTISINNEEISAYKFANKYLDSGDFIGLRGELFETKHGELTLFVNEFKLLSKAIRPLGDKWHGVKDEEKIYRQRYLDMTMNEDSYDIFLMKSKIVRALREFYRKNDFIEIETPILGNNASGAAARPFVTHHNAYDIDVYLRIAPEIGLKMATGGRFERVFEIGKSFRNEGTDPTHLQEFTSIEHYAAYWNYEDNMKFTEKLFDHLFDTLQIPRVRDIMNKVGVTKQVDFTTPWQKLDYIAQIKKDSGIDVSQFGAEDEEKLRTLIKENGHEWEGLDIQSTATMIDYLYKKVTRPKILGPAFIYNYPKTMQPLARQNDENPNIVEQFQLVVNGVEILKAYSELVDPIIQQANFDEQTDALERGDDEATSGDEEFVKTLEHGIPPQSGWGMGLERLCAVLMEQTNLRDVTMFPLMKPATKETFHEHISLSEKSESKETLGIDSLPKENQVETLIESYLNDTKRHCHQVGHIMKWFAEKKGLSVDEVHRRRVAGVLHDIDRDHIGKDPAEHLGGEFERIVGEIELHNELVDDIRSHYHEKTGVAIDSELRRYLASVDELSGFIYAYSLMRPTGLEGMNTKSVKKKIKDKSFAAGVNREHLRGCETYLGITLDEFVPQVIEALQSYSE